MSNYPPGLTTATIRVGSFVDFFGDSAAVTAKVRPVLGNDVSHIVHAPTGTVMIPASRTYESDITSGIAEFALPHADAPDWTDPAGNTVSLWKYVVTVTATLNKGFGKSLSWSKDVQPLVGQDVIDLDLVPSGEISGPVSTAPAAVLSLNGQTGHVVFSGDGATDAALAANLTNAKAYTDSELAENLADFYDPEIAFSVVDEDGRRTWIEAAPDGGPTDYAAEVLADAIGPDVKASVIESVGVTDLDTALTGLAFTVVDEDGRRTWVEADKAGRPSAWAREILRADLGILDAGSVAPQPVSVAVPSGVVRTRATADGWTLEFENVDTAETVPLYSADSFTAISAEGSRVFFTAFHGETASALTVTTTGGAAVPVSARPALAAWGDSNTAGMGATMAQAWPAVAGGILGVDVYNGGVSSSTSTEAALWQGGTQPAITVTGGAIPASGPVGVTVSDPATDYRLNYKWTFRGTLSGVYGDLVKATDNTWTFTRQTAGDAVPHIDGDRFYTTSADPHRDAIVCIMTGRNTAGRDQAIIERDYADMISHLTPYAPRFLAMALTRGAGNELGTASYNQLAAINGALASTYGPRFLDWPRWIIDNGLAFEGITPTAQDQTDIANDIVPTSLRSDGAHFNAAGYHALGHYVATVIKDKGWI